MKLYPIQNEGREAYVSEIAGRFVIPVTPTYKRTVGIVHDSSRTGKTLYVEPTQVRSAALGGGLRRTCFFCSRTG